MVPARLPPILEDPLEPAVHMLVLNHFLDEESSLSK